MRVEVHGSSDDVRSVIGNPKDAIAAALATQRAELAEAALKEQQKAFADKFLKMNGEIQEAKKPSISDKERSELVAFREQTKTLVPLVSSQELTIKKLTAQLADPIRLTTEQQEKVDALMQDTLKDIEGLQLSFPMANEPGKTVTAEQLVTTLLEHLAGCKRVVAITYVKHMTGMNFLKAKKLVDDAINYRDMHSKKVEIK